MFTTSSLTNIELGTWYWTILAGIYMKSTLLTWVRLKVVHFHLDEICNVCGCCALVVSRWEVVFFPSKCRDKGVSIC